MGPTALIFNVMRFATHDGPGIRTTVFLKGCPLACSWCHNPEGRKAEPELLYFEERCRHCGDCLTACPEHAVELVGREVRTLGACRHCGRCTEVCVAEARQIAGRRFTVGQLLTEIEKDLVFFEESGGGVTLSGGEPMAQPHFVSALLSECRRRRIRTAVETCGFAESNTFLSVALLAGLVLFDLKLVDAEKHQQQTGVSNRPILRNLEELVARGRAVTVRIPVVPGINDAEEDIGQFAGYLAKLGVRRVELLPYHGAGVGKYRRLGLTYRLNQTPPPAEPGLARFRSGLVQAGLTVAAGGRA